MQNSDPVFESPDTSTAGLASNSINPSRIGACAACRFRKVKCSGDRPVCAACRKNRVGCTYPAHVDRKRKKDKTGVDEIETGRLTSRKIRDRQSAGQRFLGVSTSPDGSFVGSEAPLASSIPHSAVPSQQGLFNNFDYTQLSSIQPTTDSSQPINSSAFDSNPHLDRWRFSLHPQSDVRADSNGFQKSLEELLAFTPAHEPLIPWADPTLGEHTRQRAASPNGQYPNANAPSQVGSTCVGGLSSPRQHSAKYRVPYFRFFGPTAIAPGYRQVIASVSRPVSPDLRPSVLSNQPTSTPARSVMDGDGEYPSFEALMHLLPLFALHFGYAFPYLRLAVDNYRNHPAHLVNIVCALAARYSPVYSRRDNQDQLATTNSLAEGSARSWASKAKERILQVLAVASVETVKTLLLIAWYEFGQDRDTGLWMYSGMSFRMGIDLGLDTIDLCPQTECNETSPPHDDHRNYSPAWSLVMLDAILTMGTGRPPMLQHSTYPSKSTLRTIPGEAGQPVPDPLQYLIRVLGLAAHLTRIFLNHELGGIQELIERAQGDLSEFHTSLPPELKFETSRFRSYAAIAQGGAFVLLHLWYHTCIILAYQPSITVSDLPASDTSQTKLAGKVIAASSAKSILDIVVFAELIDVKAVTQPWTGYPLYTAGRTFLSQSLPSENSDDNPHQAQSRPNGEIHMAKIARANFQKCVDVLGDLQSYWAGLRYIRSALVQKGEGVHSVTLTDADDVSPQVLPDRLSEWLVNASAKQNSDLVGWSYTGTMNSPTDDMLSLVSLMR